MKLFLIRHAHPIEHETKTVTTDDLRFLSAKGRRIANGFFRAISGKLDPVDMIFTSPLIRAVQTAEILAGAIGYSGDVELANELRNEWHPGTLLALIEQNSSLNGIALVGHVPRMDILLRTLCKDERSFPGFAKCGTAIIDYDTSTHAGSLLEYTDPSAQAI